MSHPEQETERWIPPSVDVDIDRKTLKGMMRRNDRDGLTLLAINLISISFFAYLYYLSWGTIWVIPTTLLYGGTMSLMAYSLSHECAHGTAFKTRWLNEAVFWFSSLLFGQEPLYRRYSHAVHHTYTWYWQKDAQMPFNQPVGLGKYLRWYTSIEYDLMFIKLALNHSLGKFSERTLGFTPESELKPMRRNSMIFLLFWLTLIVGSMYFQTLAVVYFYLIPKLVGDMINMTYVATQHFEMAEDNKDLTVTTRSIKHHWFADVFYWNMSYHIEHHVVPTVPFHALPRLNQAMKHALPEPKGMMQITKEIFQSMRQRKLGIETEAFKEPSSH